MRLDGFEQYSLEPPIERIVCHGSSGRRTVCALAALSAGQTVVFVAGDGQRRSAKLQAIEIAGRFPGARGSLILDSAEKDPFPIDGHLEWIACGFDRPRRYEFVIDGSLDGIEVLRQDRQEGTVSAANSLGNNS